MNRTQFRMYDCANTWTAALHTITCRQGGVAIPLFLSLSFRLPAQVFNIMWSGQVEQSERRWRIDQREKERWWRLFGGEGLVSFCFPPFTFTWPSFSHPLLSLPPLYWWPLVRLYSVYFSCIVRYFFLSFVWQVEKGPDSDGTMWGGTGLFSPLFFSKK